MAFDLHPSRWVAIFAAFGLFFMILGADVRYTASDSRFCLLASQSLVENGTLSLNYYASRYNLSDQNSGQNWMIHWDSTNKLVQYDYPVGTPILAAPFVAVGRALGYSPMNRFDDTDLQILIAATLLVVTFFLLFRLSLLYLDDWAALLFASLMVLGSSLTSTLGTALWSQNFEVVFICAALLELAMVERGKRERLRGGWLGLWLFLAYLCRPTAAPFILVIFAYLFWKHRKALPWAAGVSGALMLTFIIWTKISLGLWLPRYYSPGNWKPYGDYIHNLWPVLFGPNRGLFSFTPVLALLFVGFASRTLRRSPLWWMLWTWLVLLTVVILRSKNPWAGWCYGPRFYTEIIPGLALLLLMVMDGAADWALRWRKVLGTSFLALSLAGVYIHTWQGLHNVATIDWNGSPNIDQSWALVRWDWRFPQFMATHRSVGLRVREQENAGVVLERMNEIPAGGALLYGPAEPELADFFQFWNKKDRLHTGKKVYNNVPDMRDDGVREFWYDAPQYKRLAERTDVQLDPPPADSMLGPDSVKVAIPGIHLGHGRLK